MQPGFLSTTAAIALAHSANATLLVESQSEPFSGNALLLPRQANNEEAYIASVCTPNITSPVPPCQAIINIEEACQPNGTAPLNFLAHQQCMCNGGFFSNWNGCLNCQYTHGSRSEAEAGAFSSIISSASVSLCTGTPTASFAAIFSGISNSAPQQASGAATVRSDRFPSQSAVSLYYTATGPQGPGAITGSAASATAQPTSSRASSGSSARSSSSSAAASGSSSSARASGSSSAGGAASSTAARSSSASGSAAAATSSAAQTGAASGNKAFGGMAVLLAAVAPFVVL